MSASESVPTLPRVGMLATIRNRRGLITAVTPHDGGPSGRHHLVHLEYTDSDGPLDQQLIWELEPNGRLLEQTALPLVTSTAPMQPAEFDAVVRAARWGAVSPFLDPDGAEGPLEAMPIAAPFHGAIQVEDFQLVPLVKVLRMPRISLLLADDVGLGKTVEAGLILTELFIRRRIQRVLILCPAALQSQWEKEMRTKFAIAFDIVDRDHTFKLRRQLGLDANPWRSSSRVIASYHYLKQPNVLAEFNAAFRTDLASGRLPWDLLVVDEAHNLAPSAFGEVSDLTAMLRELAPKFEHRLFLTATPHNGHTATFSGLLEILDPVRFTQRNEMSEAERRRIPDVLVRRLKREVNERTSPPRFADRLPPEGVTLELSPPERALSETFSEFRTRLRSLIASGSRSGRRAGSFAVEILGKRLLSCPMAFATSWQRVRQGLSEASGVEDEEVIAAERAIRDETSDDREAEGRIQHAVASIGSWLAPHAAELESEIAAIDAAVAGLGFDLGQPATVFRPRHDARVEGLIKLIDSRLRAGDGWRADERMVVFTEYKTTLDYLLRRLLEHYADEAALVMLFGGMNKDQRDDVGDAFNDPSSPVRLLLATDAASEGLNLQETARFVMHFDVPWNPSRLEQRNGRLDRHGQARDVSVFHFVSDDDADVRFMAHVVKKLHHIREDLGATGELFDEAIHRRMVQGESVDTLTAQLDRRVDEVRRRADVPRDKRPATKDDGSKDEGERLRALAAELDLDPESLRDTLRIALSVGGTVCKLEQTTDGRTRFGTPLPPSWEPTIDETMRRRIKGSGKGPLSTMAFDPEQLVDSSSGKPVFRPRLDTVLMHLSHPLYQRALATLARARFPGATDVSASRWTVRSGNVPAGADALLLLTVEELAVNELREPFHLWTRTIAFPLSGEDLGEPLPPRPAIEWRSGEKAAAPDLVRETASRWPGIGLQLKGWLKKHAAQLTGELQAELEVRGKAARKFEQDRFQSRLGDLSQQIQSQTRERLEKEISELRAERAQGRLYDPHDHLADLEGSISAREDELRIRMQRLEELRQQLTAERERVLQRILPKRYAMRGDAQVFPVAVEFRVRGGDA